MTLFPEDQEQEEDVDAGKAIKTPKYDSTTVEHRYTELASLITYIEGYRWNVNFYHQLLGEEDAPQEPSTDLSPVHQQYDLIEDFELRVQDALTYEYNETYDQDILTGAAIIYPGTVHPQIKDAFIAEIGDGRRGIFVINDVESKSIMTQRAYEVTYTLMTHLDENRKEDFENKTQRRLLFVKDFLLHGRNPLITPIQRQIFSKLTRLKGRLIDDYGARFIDPSYRYLLVSEQNEPTYDHFLAMFFRKLLTISQHRFYRQANWPSIYKLRDLRTITFWDLLLKPYQDIDETQSMLEPKIKPISISYLKSNPSFQGFYYSRIKYILWPMSDEDVVFTELVRNESDKQCLYHQYEPYPDNVTPPGDGSNDTYELENGEQLDRAAIYPIDVDEYYVLSKAFYDKDRVNMSHVEFFIDQVMHGENIDVELLFSIVKDSYHWDDLESFYYIPILIVLIDHAHLQIR